MKLITTITVMALTVSSYAAQNTATKKKTAKKKTPAATVQVAANNAAPAVTEPSIVETTAPAAANTTVAAAATQTSTTSVEALAPADAKKWNLSLDIAAERSMEPNPEVEALTTNYLGYSYKLSDNVKLGARQYFVYSAMADEDVQTRGQVADFMPFASITQKDVLGGSTLVHTLRFYVPVGQSSRAVSSNGRFRYIFNPSWDIGNNFNLDYVLDNNFYFINQGAAEARDYYALNVVELGYTINDSLSLYQDLGFTHTVHAKPAVVQEGENLYVGTGISIKASKNVSILAEVSQKHPVKNVGNEKFALYKNSQSTGLIELTMTY